MKFVCIGDSLTYGYKVSRSEIWTKLFSEKYQIEVLNKGINGDTTAGMLSRFYHDVVSHGPTHVLVMGGTNDYIMGASLNMVRLNISTMVHQAFGCNIVPVIGIQILTDTVMAKEHWSNITDFQIVNDEIAKYRRWVYKFAEIFNVKIIDFYKDFNTQLEKSDNSPLYLDGLHPTPKGHEIMAESIHLSTRSGDREK